MHEKEDVPPVSFWRRRRRKVGWHICPTSVGVRRSEGRKRDLGANWGSILLSEATVLRLPGQGWASKPFLRKGTLQRLAQIRDQRWRDETVLADPSFYGMRTVPRRNKMKMKTSKMRRDGHAFEKELPIVRCCRGRNPKGETVVTEAKSV